MTRTNPTMEVGPSTSFKNRTLNTVEPMGSSTAMEEAIPAGRILMPLVYINPANAAVTMPIPITKGSRTGASMICAPTCRGFAKNSEPNAEKQKEYVIWASEVMSDRMAILVQIL